MRRMISDTLQTYLKAVKNNYPDPSNIGGKVNLEVDNITAMTTAQLNDLKAGDIVLKKTGNMKHTYVVTYKEENKGICLSYFAAGYLETVSYDYVTNAWVYNSTDVVTVPEAQVQSDWDQSDNTKVDYIKNKPTIPAAVSGTNDGTNWTSLTVGNDTYNIPQGGGGSATLYRHHVGIFKYGSDWSIACAIYVDFVSTSNTQITSVNAINTLLSSATGMGSKGIIANGALKDGSDVRHIIELTYNSNGLQGQYVDTSTVSASITIPTDADVSDVVYTL